MLLKYLGFCGSKNASSSEKRYPSIIEELCHRFSLQDLRKSTNNFDSRLIIGRDGYVTMYKGCLKHDGANDYAIGLRRRRRNFPHSLKKELELLCQLRHPNLVSLIGFCIHEDEEIIVQEYMPNGSLYDKLNNRDNEPLSWKKRLEICIGAARGLHYLHTGAKRTIFHRDIKPHNILLDHNMVSKLSGFVISLQGPLSMSKPKPIEVTSIEGTFGYAAPEYVRQGTLTDKCDVYSFGMVLLEVICTKDRQRLLNKANMLEAKLFNDPLHLGNIISIMQQFPIEEIIDPVLEGKIAPECWEVFIDITQRCLQEEPDERPTMGEVEVLLELALSLQEEADIRRNNGDYTLLSTTFIDKEPTIYLHGEEMLCHQFSLADIKQTTHNFNERRILGRGSFGTMYRGHIRLNGRIHYSIAIQRLEWSSICERGNQWNFRKEIENICQLRQTNLVSLIGFCDDHDEKILVYMFNQNGLIYYPRPQYPPWKERLKICIGAVQGLDYLHRAAIFPRNIKLNTIFLDMVPFPWSKPIHAEGYPAPEWLQGHDFTYKCDVYSFGVVLLQMVSGNESPIIEVEVDPKLKGKIAPRCWEVFLDITKRCLKFDANERPTMSEVEAQLQHALALQEEADASTGGDYCLSYLTFDSLIG